MGDICLLAEDLLDPFNDYLLEFHQEDQKEGPISIHADMLTAQSLTIPLPKDLKPGPVHIKIYPYRFGSITFKSSTVKPTSDPRTKTDLSRIRRPWIPASTLIIFRRFFGTTEKIPPRTAFG